MSKLNNPAVSSMACAKTGCGPLPIPDCEANLICPRCGLIYSGEGDKPRVDLTATRAALFRAADACSGSLYSLQALAFDRYGVDPASPDRIDQLALAET
jgi:hypothetical protein